MIRLYWYKVGGSEQLRGSIPSNVLKSKVLLLTSPEQLRHPAVPED